MTNYPKAKRSDIDLKIMQSGIKYIADKHSKGFKKGFGHRKEWQDSKDFKTNRYCSVQIKLALADFTSLEKLL